MPKQGAVGINVLGFLRHKMLSFPTLMIVWRQLVSLLHFKTSLCVHEHGEGSVGHLAKDGIVVQSNVVVLLFLHCIQYFVFT